MRHFEDMREDDPCADEWQALLDEADEAFDTYEPSLRDLAEHNTLLPAWVINRKQAWRVREALLMLTGCAFIVASIVGFAIAAARWLNG